MKWLKKIFPQKCEHDWEVVLREDIVITDEFNTGSPDKPVGYKYVEIMKCKKCGKIWKQEVMY